VTKIKQEKNQKKTKGSLKNTFFQTSLDDEVKKR